MNLKSILPLIVCVAPILVTSCSKKGSGPKEEELASVLTQTINVPFPHKIDDIKIEYIPQSENQVICNFKAEIVLLEDLYTGFDLWDLNLNLKGQVKESIRFVNNSGIDATPLQAEMEKINQANKQVFKKSAPEKDRFSVYGKVTAEWMMDHWVISQPQFSSTKVPDWKGTPKSQLPSFALIEGTKETNQALNELNTLGQNFVNVASAKMAEEAELNRKKEAEVLAKQKEAKALELAKQKEREERQAALRQELINSLKKGTVYSGLWTREGRSGRYTMTILNCEEDGEIIDVEMQDGKNSDFVYVMHGRLILDKEEAKGYQLILHQDKDMTFWYDRNDELMREIWTGRRATMKLNYQDGIYKGILRAHNENYSTNGEVNITFKKKQ